MTQALAVWAAMLFKRDSATSAGSVSARTWRQNMSRRVNVKYQVLLLIGNLEEKGAVDSSYTS